MAEEKLSNYGYGFQSKLIVSLMTDKEFLKQIYDLLEPEYFDSEANSNIVKFIKNDYKQFKTVSLDTLKIQIKEIENEVLRASIIESLKDAYKHIQGEDLHVIKHEALNFCFNQNLKNVIYESVDLLKYRKYDDIKKKIDDAMKAGISRDIGSNYKEDIDKRYGEDDRKPITTGWTVIDDITNGGAAAGELWIMVSGPGGGKCVGPKTEIEIQYEQIGIENKNSDGDIFILWLDPWKKYQIDNFELTGREIEILMTSGAGKSIGL